MLREYEMENDFDQVRYLDEVSMEKLSQEECRHILERLSMHELLDERPTIGAICEATGVDEARVIGLLAEVRGENWKAEIKSRVVPLEESVQAHEQRIVSLEKGRSIPPLLRDSRGSYSESNDLLARFVVAVSIVFVFVVGMLILSGSGKRSVPESLRGSSCYSTMTASEQKEFCIDTAGDSWVRERGVRRELTAAERESSEYTSILWMHYREHQGK